MCNQRGFVTAGVSGSLGAWRVGCDVLVGSIWQALMASLQAMAVRSLVLAAVAAAVLLLRR